MHSYYNMPNSNKVQLTEFGDMNKVNNTQNLKIGFESHRTMFRVTEIEKLKLSRLVAMYWYRVQLIIQQYTV